jgi:hypothetical protein
VTFVLATVVNSLAVAAGEFAPGSPAADPGPLADRKAIEEVYWSHRIWPSVNRASKPELSAVLVDSVLRERIADHLRKRAALEKYWSRRVTAPQVQAELDRMAAHTKAPKVLAEIFAALHNDPQRIAASLAEPALVDRLIRSWYAGDGRFHEEAQRRAERSLARPDNAADLRAMDGEFVETEYLRRDAAAPASSGGDGSLEDGASGAALDAAAWAGLLGRLATASTWTARRGRGRTPCRGGSPAGSSTRAMPSASTVCSKRGAIECAFSRSPGRSGTSTTGGGRRGLV